MAFTTVLYFYFEISSNRNSKIHTYIKNNGLYRYTVLATQVSTGSGPPITNSKKITKPPSDD